MIDSTPITQSALETYLWGAATLLRGTIDAGDYKQFIFPLLFWKRLCDVYDEETARAMEWIGEVFPEDHRFQIPDGAHWDDVRQVSTNVGTAIQDAMYAIESANPDMLSGIFGDAPWTNKNRLSDDTLKNLIEHFSTQTLSMVRVSDDLLGKAYEFLIKKFADDSGHTAAEFYTNRTVVHLMALMLEPQPGEAVYDPTCGSGGMLIEATEKLKREERDYRTLRLYGQEINLMTSAMARMNLFMHGFEDFAIVRGDTLANPHFHTHNRLQQFDVVLANPPYSIKQWNRAAWENDPYGRNLYGTPPQGRADYAFFQHIIASLKPDMGRCAILFPHGVLFREEERHMRSLLVQADVIECIVGLGPNLFYNSPMEACVIVCRMTKPAARSGKILFINAVNEVTRERASSFLEDVHIARIVDAYRAFADEDSFARVVTTDEVLRQNANLNIPLYIQPPNGTETPDKPLNTVIAEWQQSSAALRRSMDELFDTLQPESDVPEEKDIPPGVVTASVGRIALQMYDFSQLFAPVNQHLSDIIGGYAQMPDLQMLLGINLDAIRTVSELRPQIDTTQFARSLGDIAGLDEIRANHAETLSEIVKPYMELVDTSGFGARFFEETGILNHIKETNNLLASTALADMQAAMGIVPDFGDAISDFLATLTATNRLELRSSTGNAQYFEPAFSVISGETDIEELPEELKSEVKKSRDFVYKHGIAAAALLAWAVNLLWLISDESFEAGSSVTNTLLTIIIILSDMSRNDKE